MHMKQPLKSARHYFTLIELLVVVAILSILMSLFAPALRTAMYKAKVTKCIMNLKQIGHTTNLYTDDYNEFYPVDVNHRYTGSGVRSHPQTFGEDDILRPYFGSDQAMRGNYICPLIEDKVNEEWPEKPFPLPIGNGGEFQTYALWYQCGRDSANILPEDRMQRVGDRFKVTGARWAGAIRGKYFDIIASDQLCSGGRGILVNHVPRGEQIKNPVYLEWQWGTVIEAGHWSTWQSINFNANYLYSDGHVAHRDDLIIGLTLGNMGHGFLPISDAYDSEDE